MKNLNNMIISIEKVEELSALMLAQQILASLNQEVPSEKEKISIIRSFSKILRNDSHLEIKALWNDLVRFSIFLE